MCSQVGWLARARRNGTYRRIGGISRARASLDGPSAWRESQGYWTLPEGRILAPFGVSPSPLRAVHRRCGTRRKSPALCVLEGRGPTAEVGSATESSPRDFQPGSVSWNRRSENLPIVAV